MLTQLSALISIADKSTTLASAIALYASKDEVFGKQLGAELSAASKASSQHTVNVLTAQAMAANSSQVATAVTVTDKHVVFELPAGWPAVRSDKSERKSYYANVVGVHVPVAKKRLNKAGLLTESVQRKVQRYANWPDITVGDTFPVGHAFMAKRAAGESAPAPAPEVVATTAVDVVDKKIARRQARHEVTAQSIVRDADGNVVTAIGVANGGCTCSSQHDCPFVKFHDGSNPYKA